MSHYVSRLLKPNGRDMVGNWPTAPGVWKLNENVNRLAAFAAALDVPDEARAGDPLKSVPSPWARLLLFESALFNEAHPAHGVTLGQWRGLLGLFALARSLRLSLTATAVRIQDFAVPGPTGELAKSFIDLNPGIGETEGKDDNRWNYFYILALDGVDIACTSPRTLLFTRLTSALPPSIPFQERGLLVDPVAYYKRYDDKACLGLIRSWLTTTIANVEQNKQLAHHLGRTPAAPGAVATSRQQLILTQLREWEADLAIADPIMPTGAYQSPFGGPPYSEVLSLMPPFEFDPRARRSDLQIDGKINALVTFDRGASRIFNPAGAELQTERLKVFDGRWVEADRALPVPFTFLPPDYRTVAATELFEPMLIPVRPPSSGSVVYTLDYDPGDGSAARHFLLPLKKEVLEILDAPIIHRNLRVSFDRSRNRYSVELALPLVGGRTIRTLRHYAVDTEVVADVATQEVAMWPDFASPHWKHYFYFKSSAAEREVVLEPLDANTSRAEEGVTWMVSERPVDAFIGTFEEHFGLLPLRQDQKQFGAPTEFWRVGIDFGSTHTRAFYVPLESARADAKAQSRTVQPIEFLPRTVPITYSDPAELARNFCAARDAVDAQQQLKSVLMVPVNDQSDHQDWLQREGFVYTSPLHTHDYDARYLRLDLKWDHRVDNYDLRSFLRCLLTMVEAEAFVHGAAVVDIARSYPSVFTPTLLAKQRAEWAGLEQYLNRARGGGPRVVCKTELTETVAVCRHLELEGAPVAVNTIVLDVGGSTTDIAVWGGGQLLVQESVKMAGGVLGRFFGHAEAAPFRRWLEERVGRAPYRIENVKTDSFADDSGGLALLFHSLLSTVEQRRLTDVLSGEIMGTKEAFPLLAHNIFLFSGLFYYAGLLARKANLQISDGGPVYIHVCGRGGQFLDWVVAREVLAGTSFRAGFAGSATAQAAPEVDLKVSGRPKEEVGRGLLADSILAAQPVSSGVGLLRLTAPSVTVAETGYGQLQWNGTLDDQVLRTLTPAMLPAKAQMRELNTFVDAFIANEATRGSAEILGIAAVKDSRYVDRLRARLFGQARGSIIRDVREDPNNALIEPLFITEIKVLLEVATGNAALFADGD